MVRWRLVFIGVALLSFIAVLLAGEPLAIGQNSGDCTITTSRNVNQRSGPAAQYLNVGQFTAGSSATGIGQSIGSDGILWYQLADSIWVRSDLVNASAECASLPEVTRLANGLPTNRGLVPDSAEMLTGGVGLTNGAPQGAGEFQVEWFCQDQGYGIRNDNDNWYCTSGGRDIKPVTVEDFDLICQTTYSNFDAFAIQSGDSRTPAYRWRCFSFDVATACPALVRNAMAAVEEACTGVGRNEACYGNIQVSASPTSLQFSAPGDLINVSDIEGLQLSSMDVGADQWGISLLEVQATLPDNSATNVQLLLFGNVEVFNEDGETPSTDPLQKFAFRSGVDDSPCEEAPDSGILIQTPEGQGEITFLINEVSVSLGSTAYIQAEWGNEMEVAVIEGQGTITANGATQIVSEGALTSITLNANGDASGVPSPPVPYDDSRMIVLPIQLLDRQIAVAPPGGWTTTSLTGTHWRFGRNDGSTLATDLVLEADGTISGYNNPNEDRWAVDNGILVFYATDGRESTRFTNLEVTEGARRLNGAYLLDPNVNVIHILTQVGGFVSVPDLVPGTRQLSVTLPATMESWLDTGLVVNPGDVLRFETIGEVDLWPNCFRENNDPNIDCNVHKHVSPNGMTGILADAAKYLPGAPVGAVVGRIDENRPFLVGSSGEITARESGRLQLVINDVVLMSDNTGRFLVTITVIPAGGSTTPAPNSNLAGLEVDTGFLSFVLNPALGNSFTVKHIPAGSNTPNSAFWDLNPDYDLVQLDDYPVPTSFILTGIRVFPVQEYAAISPGAAESIAQMQALLSAPTEFPQVPYINQLPAFQSFQSHQQYLNFANGTGYRYITRWATRPLPVVAEDEFFYSFNGMTNDGRYWVSVSLKVQPSHFPEMPFATESALSDPGVQNDYFASVMGIFGTLDADEFTPNLALLDELVQSFLVGDGSVVSIPATPIAAVPTLDPIQAAAEMTLTALVPTATPTATLDPIQAAAEMTLTALVPTATPTATVDPIQEAVQGTLTALAPTLPVIVTATPSYTPTYTPTDTTTPTPAPTSVAGGPAVPAGEGVISPANAAQLQLAASYDAFLPSRDLRYGIATDLMSEFWVEDLASGERVFTLGVPPAFQFSPDGRLLYVITGSPEPPRLQVYATGTWQALNGFDSPALNEIAGQHVDFVSDAGLTRLSFSGDGRVLVVESIGAAGMLVHFVDSQTGEVIGQLQTVRGLLQYAAINYDGSQFAATAVEGPVSFSNNNILHVYPTAGFAYNDESGSPPPAPLHQFSSDTDRILTAAFSPDGRLVATSGPGSENSIQVWDLNTESLHTALAGRFPANYLGFSVDGSLIVSSGDAGLNLWAVQDGTLLHTIATVGSAPFNMNGTALIVYGSIDNATQVYTLGGRDPAEASAAVPQATLTQAAGGEVFAIASGNGARLLDLPEGGTGPSVLRTVPNNARLRVVGRLPEGWLLVEFEGQQGWVFNDTTSIRAIEGNLESVSIVEPFRVDGRSRVQTSTPTRQFGELVDGGCSISTRNDVNLRAEPSTDAAVAGRFLGGETRLSDGYIRTANGSFWLHFPDDTWVRADVVIIAQETPGCRALPTLEGHVPAN